VAAEPEFANSLKKMSPYLASLETELPQNGWVSLTGFIPFYFYEDDTTLLVFLR